jgi:O-antigen ligase
MWIRRLILLIVFMGWVSLPGSEAVLDPSFLHGWALAKALCRFVPLIYIFCIFVPNFKKFGWILKPPMVWIFLYILWCGITILLSENKFYSFYRWVETIVMFFLPVALVRTIKEVKEVNNFINDFFIIAITFIASALLLFFIMPEWGGKFSGFEPLTGAVQLRLGGNFFRTDVIAGLSLIIFLFYFSQLINSIAFKSQLKKICIILLPFLVLLLSYSRAAIVSAILFSSFAIWKTRKTLKWKTAWLMLIIGVGVNIRIFIDWFVRYSTVESLLTLNSRLYIWKTLLSEFIGSSSVITGYGYLTNSSEGLDFFVPEMGRYMNQPHNGFLSVLIGTGIIGFILILFIIKSWFKYRQKLKTDIRFPIESMHLAILGALLHTTMDFGIWGVPSPEMLIFFAFLVISNKIILLKRNDVI